MKVLNKLVQNSQSWEWHQASDCHPSDLATAEPDLSSVAWQKTKHECFFMMGTECRSCSCDLLFVSRS